ncbi:SPW_0924 family protein [Streptomyces hundungensis]|uniref:SPW_0924 family protein n=1 Tax=Streptomyces hundungensis TaxID=1077946 RepID=UPI0033D30DF3
MRALIAAATGLVAALALVLTVSAIGAPEGTTSPHPLLTTVPSAPGKITQTK